MAADPTPAPEGDAIQGLLAADAASPLDAAGLAELVAVLAKADRDGEASIFAARLLKLRPTHKRALRALTRSPRPEVDVIGGWRALAQTAPDDAEPWLQIARLASRAKDPRTALEACEEMLTRESAQIEALSLKLAALSALRMHDEVGSTWRRLHEADAERARGILARAADGADIDTAAAMLGAAGALGALDADGEHQRLKLRSRLTMAAYDAELAADDSAAAQNFWRLTRLEPSMADHADGLKRALARLRARIDNAGAAPEAELAGAARTLVRFEASHGNAHLVLGRAAALTGGWAEAADAFTQALLLGADDDDGKLLLEHSAACARCGRLGEAVQSWKRARALAEDEAEPAARAIGAQTLLRGLAEAAHEVAADRGDWPGAWASLDALTELEDDSAAMEGRTQRLVKATAKALGQAADERDPRIFALAQLLIDHGRGDSRTRVILGRALSRERRHEEALTVWRALAAERPDSVEPHLQIARLAKRLDQADLGRRAADAVLALEPGHAEAGELRTLFDEAPSLG